MNSPIPNLVEIVVGCVVGCVVGYNVSHWAGPKVKDWPEKIERRFPNERGSSAVGAFVPMAAPNSKVKHNKIISKPLDPSPSTWQRPPHYHLSPGCFIASQDGWIRVLRHGSDHLITTCRSDASSPHKTAGPESFDMAATTSLPPVARMLHRLTRLLVRPITTCRPDASLSYKIDGLDRHDMAETNRFPRVARHGNTLDQHSLRRRSARPFPQSGRDHLITTCHPEFAIRWMTTLSGGAVLDSSLEAAEIASLPHGIRMQSH
ncbi:hypothetical protein Q7P37_006143 [Cladosporium fusiforme]